MQNETVGKHLSIAFRKHRNVLTALLHDAGLDLGSGQFPLLISLYTQDGQNQQALCRTFDIDKGAVARGVKKLAGKGLVTKVTDPGDSRKTLLRLTPKAEALRPVLSSILAKVDSWIKEDLSAEEMESFFQLMGKLESSLQKALQGSTHHTSGTSSPVRDRRQGELLHENE
jgi:DNA-binding MarR family transcriptional regulator